MVAGLRGRVNRWPNAAVDRVGVRRRVSLTLGLFAGACAFDASGVGSSGATLGGAGTTTTSTDAGPSTLDTSGAPESEAESGSMSGTGAPDDAALLVLEDAPIFDFADIILGEVQTHGFVLRNDGTAAATNVAASVDAAPFAFSGGVYPGTGGTCTETLPPGTSCVLVLACTPAQWGPAAAALSVTYGDATGGSGAIAAMLRARGIGRTDNLLVNGDAEQGGSPPTGWLQSDGGGENWQTTGSVTFAGAMAIWAGEGSGVTSFRLRQSVGVDPWVALVDAGDLRFRAAAHTRAYEQDNDPHQVRLRFFDDADELLGEEVSTVYAGAAWNATEVEATAPPFTRLVQVQLRCTRNGGDYCDGYFDDVSLVAIYE